MRKYLKSCVCGKRYYGNSEDRGCEVCISKGRMVSLMKSCECGCKREFKKGGKRKYYDRACQMRVIRRTDAGKAYTEEYNKRYKRPEVEIGCKFPLCGVVFKSAYRRKYCDEHSNPVSVSKVWRKNNPLKAKAHERINSMYRDRRNYRDDIINKRDVCIVCGKEPTQAHHHNYKKPLDVIFLCHTHHKEIHKWDAITV